VNTKTTEQTAQRQLLVLAGSHFCERALWASQAVRQPLPCVVLAPGLHVVTLRRAAPGLASTALPVMLGPSGAVAGSSAILDVLGLPLLQPAAETWLVEQVGPLVRRVFYAALSQQPVLAQQWAVEAYAPGPRWLARSVAWAPCSVLKLLLWREGARVSNLSSWVDDLQAAGAQRADLAQAELQALLKPNSTGQAADLSRLALTCGALLGPLLWPAPAPWQHAPWSAALLPTVQALQRLPWWQLAHAAWAQRRQIALQERPDQGGFASSPPQSPQTPARGPATGDQGSA
jgi:hypothetical protein